MLSDTSTPSIPSNPSLLQPPPLQPLLRLNTPSYPLHNTPRLPSNGGQATRPVCRTSLCTAHNITHSHITSGPNLQAGKSPDQSPHLMSRCSLKYSQESVPVHFCLFLCLLHYLFVSWFVVECISVCLSVRLLVSLFVFCICPCSIFLSHPL